MAADSKLSQSAGSNARIFISYSRKDVAFADRLDAGLKARGFEPLIDREEIYAFEDWWKRLQALIMRADTVVFVISPDSVISRETLKEVEYASSLNKRFAPIVCRRVEDSTVPETLRRLNLVFFDDPAQFEANADRLAEALSTDIAWIRKHTEYGEVSRHWSAAGRPGGLLLRSPVLEEAERWISSRPLNAPAPTEETQAFITESRHGATRRRNILTGSLAAGLVVALCLAGLAYWQRTIALERLDEARRNLVASLIAQSHVNLSNSDLVAALQNALKAAETESTFAGDGDVRASDDALRRILSADRLVLHVQLQPNALWRPIFEFINDHTLAYTDPEQGLFVVDLNHRRLAWQVKLPQLHRPEHMRVAWSAECILVSSGSQLAVIDFHTHRLRQTLEFDTDIHSFDIHDEEASVAVGLTRSLALFSLVDEQIAPQKVALEAIAGDEVIKQTAFNRTGERLYVVAGDALDEHVSMVEYHYPDGRLASIKLPKGALVGGLTDLAAYGGSDQALIYLAFHQFTLGVIDTSNGVISDLRPAMLAAWKTAKGPFMYPVGFHYLNDAVLDKNAQLFAISRSDDEEVMTIAVQLFSADELYYLDQIKYRPRESGAVDLERCRVSGDHGYLACAYSSGMLVWNLAETISIPKTTKELVQTARRMLRRLTLHDSFSAPFAVDTVVDAPADQTR
jgi:hypothetical protein